MMTTKNIISACCCVLLGVTGMAAAVPTAYNPGIKLCGLSDSGLYAIGVQGGDDEVDNPRMAGGQLVDLRDNTITEIKAPTGWADVNDVADDGTVVGSESGKPATWSPATGKWTTYDVPKEWGGGVFTSVTPDGRYAVGYYTYPDNEFLVVPMYYDLTTGQARAITNLPTVDLSGQDQHMNVFYGLSPDGRYVLGQMSQSYLLPVSLFSYVYDTQTDTWDPIGYTYDPSTKTYTPQVDHLHFVMSQYMSCDGMWVTGTAYVVRGGGETVGGTEGLYPYRYNVATHAFELFDTANDENVAGNRITNDGVVLAATPAGNPYPSAMVRSGRYFVSLEQIAAQVYGLEPSRFFPPGVSGAYRALSADGLTALMETYDESYILYMPESLAEAAAKVNLLANYTVNIPDGSSVSRVSEIKITFDRAIDVMNYPQNVNLLDADGKSVRTALGFSISPTNPNTVVVSFRSTALEPGKDYTVDIPAGMVWIKDDTSVKSANIKIHYRGRSEGAISVVSVNPPAGAALTQFNSNPDYLAVTFDTPVAVSADARCVLYNADADQEIAEFAVSSEGNTAYFFPTTAYLLYKGSDYRVVISAGSVTDLSGAGGCEEIVLNYRGAYVRDLSPDDIYVFNSACDSYDKFIFWSTERHEPGAVPRQWGFTADNPWLLLRDNEQSDDWALAAHSMFATPAESDDWLVTPQLFIPDESTYLAFDAQSYLNRKEDVLKVYVYATDAVYNYFSDELAETFRRDGELVLDEVIPAGATDSGLDGEWTHYTISLEKYVGKNIYIAFVNNNYDKSAIFIDDVQVIRNVSLLLTNQTPRVVVDVDHTEVSGMVSLGVDDPCHGLELTLRDSAGNELDRISEPDYVLSKGDVYRFAFGTKLPLDRGYETSYSISIKAGDTESQFFYSVKDLLFEVNKKVVLEEYTGSACGNCPLGIQAIENLKRLFPDNFIPVTLRTYMNDMYAAGITDYTAYLGLNGAPTGRINRGEVLSPMVQTADEGYQYFGRGITASDGSDVYLWADAVQDELAVPAEAQVTLSVDWNPQTGHLSVPSNVRFALNGPETTLGVYAVVIEDGLPTYQLNYFNTVSDPNLGPWGVGGMYAQNTVTSWVADDVARFTVNAYGGTPIVVGSFVAGEDYALTLEAEMPANKVNNPANCHVVAMLIDRGTGRVINAETAPLQSSGIAGVDSDDAEPVYYNLQGVRVDHPVKGSVYVRVTGSNAVKIRF